MAEKTNVEVVVFVADNTYYVASGRMELLPSFLRARLSAAARMIWYDLNNVLCLIDMLIQCSSRRSCLLLPVSGLWHSVIAG